MTKATTTTATTQLGSTGPHVFPIALGCMGMSPVYGATDDDESVATVHAAIDAGVNLLDTGDFYGMGHNELLLRRAIAGRRDKVLLSVKFGALRGPDGAWLGFDARPAAVKNFVTHSLTRLGVDHIDIYRPARLDAQVPIEDTVGAIADLIKAGYVRHIGLSEVGADTIRRAHKVHPITDLQIEYSLASRGPEAKIFPVLEELGISATLYSVLARGQLGGSTVTASPTDFRRHMPRFAGDNAAQNAALVEKLRAFAAARQLTSGQAAIAYVLAKQPRLVPVIGARTRTQLADAVAALARPFSAADVAELEALIPAGAFAGDRYQAAQMAHLDSEK